MPVALVAQLLFKLAFMMAIGFFLRKKGIIDDAFQSKLSQMMLVIIIPLGILAVGNNTYDATTAKGLLWTALFNIVTFAAMYTGLFFLSRHLRLGQNAGMFVNLSSLGNVLYIGFPLILALYGPEGSLYSIVSSMVFNFVAYTISIALLNGGFKLRMAISPLTVSALLAILLFITPLRLPGWLVTTFSSVGDLSGPFSMFIIGSAMGKVKFHSIFTEKGAWLAVLFKQVVCPGLVAVVLWALGFRGVLPSTFVVLSSLPCATMNVILAEQYEQDMPFTSRSVVLSTLLMVVFLPLTLLLCNALFM